MHEKPPTDLAQDARITAANLLAIVDSDERLSLRRAAYAIDKMREAAHILGACAAIIAPPVADRDDETFGPAKTDDDADADHYADWLHGQAEEVRRAAWLRIAKATGAPPYSLETVVTWVEEMAADKRREFFRAIDDAESQRKYNAETDTATSLGHDIGAEVWHREQALWADKHRPRQDDIGGRVNSGSTYNAETVPIILRNEVGDKMYDPSKVRVTYQGIDCGMWDKAIKDTDSHVTVTHKGVPDSAMEWQQSVPLLTQEEAEKVSYQAVNDFIAARNRNGIPVSMEADGLLEIERVAQQELGDHDPGRWMVSAAKPDSDWSRTPVVTVRLRT